MKIIYNGKWHNIWDRPKYQYFRDKILDSFKDLTFVEDGHKYYLHGKEITCVSNVTHLYKEPFDSDKMCVETSKRHFDDPNSQYFQKTPEEIKKMWEDNSRHACEHGTERHEFGESCFYFMTEQYDKILPAFKDRLVMPTKENTNYGFVAIYPKEEAVLSFYEQCPQYLVPILAETKVYDEDLGYSGTFDILFYYDSELNEGKAKKWEGLVVLDWKTNKDLDKNFNDKRLLEPFTDLKDCSLNIYKLQLSLYQNCIEKIGEHVSARQLLWLKPDGNFEKRPLECYVDRLRKDLSKRKLI